MKRKKYTYGEKLPKLVYGGEMIATQTADGYYSPFTNKQYDTEAQANKYNFRKYTANRNKGKVGKKILAGLAGFTSGIADMGIIPGGEQISSAIKGSKLMNDPSVAGAASIGSIIGNVGEGIGNVLTGQYKDLVDTGMDIAQSSTAITQSYTNDMNRFNTAGKVGQGFEAAGGIVNSITGMMSGGGMNFGGKNMNANVVEERAVANKINPNYRYGGRMRRYTYGGQFKRYSGNLHKDGGIPIDNNLRPTNRSLASAEVENNETSYKDYIFSDNLKIKINKYKSKFQ
jgi:hypothetical protein